MATKTRRLPVRSAPLASNSYGRTRAAVGVVIFILFFGLLWMVNGHWTAEGVQAVFRGDYAVGWAVHLLITALEVLPIFVLPYIEKQQRLVLLLIWGLSLPFGVFDVFSSAVGIMPLLHAIAVRGEALTILSTLLGEAVAFVPERAFVALLVVLQRIYRG